MKIENCLKKMTVSQMNKYRSHTCNLNFKPQSDSRTAGTGPETPAMQLGALRKPLPQLCTFLSKEKQQ